MNMINISLIIISLMKCTSDKVSELSRPAEEVKSFYPNLN